MLQLGNFFILLFFFPAGKIFCISIKLNLNYWDLVFWKEDFKIFCRDLIRRIFIGGD